MELASFFFLASEDAFCQTQSHIAQNFPAGTPPFAPNRVQDQENLNDCFSADACFLNQAIDRTYTFLLEVLPPVERTLLVQEHEDWIKSRDTKQENAWLLLKKTNENTDISSTQSEREENLKGRLRVLNTRLMGLLLPLLESIPSNPEPARAFLEKCPTALGRAWLAFMIADGSLPSANPHGDMNQIYKKMRSLFPEISEFYQFIDPEGDYKTKLAFSSDQSTLLDKSFRVLRMAYEQEQCGSETVNEACHTPCFVEGKYPEESIALTIFWWCTRDAFAPRSTCPPPTLFSEIHSYPVFKELIDRLDGLTTYEETKAWPGTMSMGIWGVNRKWLMHLERSPLSPILAETLSHGKELWEMYLKEESLGSFDHWEERKGLLDQFRQARHDFEVELAHVLEQKEGLPTNKAVQVAQDTSLALIDLWSSYKSLP